MTVAQFRVNSNGPELTTLQPQGLANADNLRFTPFDPLVGFDYNGDGVVNAQDVTDLRSDIVAIVQRYYQPFDIDVVAQASANAAGPLGLAYRLVHPR